MFFNSYADPAGLPPTNSPSLLNFCQPYELNDPELYSSISPNPHKYHEHSPSNLAYELPLPPGHEYAGYSYATPIPNHNEYQDLGYPEINYINQADARPFAESFPLQSLFNTPPTYSQSSFMSPRLSNTSMEFATAFSQMSSPNFSTSDILPSSILPPSHGQYSQICNEMSYLEPETSMPTLNLQTPHSSFFTNITEVPVHQGQEVWTPQQATPTTSQPKSKRKATPSKRASPLSATHPKPYPIISSLSSKSDQTHRAKKSARRSSHVILTDSPVSITQGGYARKYACTWDGCGKAFTTSGHLVRHKRIHTGEKRYECAMQNCTSRFSRQDNMLQHYRTHFSSKSRRIPPVSTVTSNHPSHTSDTSSSATLVVPQLRSFSQFFVGQSAF
ncbi:hypothetical protein MJO29_006241 [Puccinia striiformis f. sp. tritici]|uniref:hypothetical protein n=1 Tax=Puccinia striiformis f. sp. tritici TaxID=168172 RepID=UPI00200795AC|nr:hypothetical protein Pst134EA_011458 [Puccinia striiformis f. sp. tritici]KAH9467836.1 hypothetical protein Pst134EA_011458 [Puccinia striiformis f. sp. tritici]KAI7958024.1 hypothetical protein MJO29_006241 [Puccinia striiformis f. sp. tritici]KAI9605046.1 hypothetical protein H4Q26_003017 [Puccinia striiformis f. sp. tritici PST-130]